MARKIDVVPPIQRGGGVRKSVWTQYANGDLWELNVFDDLNYPVWVGEGVEPDGISWRAGEKAPKTADDHAKHCQARALNAARQWASNHDYHVLVRRQGVDKVVVRFTHDPERKLRS